MNDTAVSSGNSAHTNIFTILRKEILRGKFEASRKFPSEHQLMRRFRVSRSTVRLALEKLKQDGILETRNGSGTYLSPLAKRVTGLLGLIVPHIAGGEIATPVCSEISKVASEAGYTLLFGNASSEIDDVRAQRFMTLAWDYVSHGVAGVFIEPIERVQNMSSVTMRVISFLEDHHIPVILLDRDIVPPPERSRYDLVTLDNVQIGYRLATHLIQRGAKSICLFGMENSAPTVTLRFQGAREAILDAGFAWRRSNIHYGDPDDISAVQKLFTGSGRPDAFLCANDITAVSLMNTLRRLGKNVPGDILITGVDDVQVAATSTPPLTTVHQPCKEIARAAVAAMLQRLRDPSLPPRQILLDAELIVRASTERRINS